MKGRTATDLRNLTNEELSRTLIDAQETLMNLRFQKVLGELQNSAYLRTLRRDIARISTIIVERKKSA